MQEVLSSERHGLVRRIQPDEEEGGRAEVKKVSDEALTVIVLIGIFTFWFVVSQFGLLGAGR